MNKFKEYIEEQQRHFSAHHILIGSAYIALKQAKNKQPAMFYNQLITITMCGLALEALANAFGERFVENWKHFENSSPIAKLRVVCTQLEIVPIFHIEPWSSIPWLIKFRNKIAHAKPEIVKEKAILTEAEYYNRHSAAKPKSKLESDVTLPNAERAFTALVQLKKILCENIPEDKLEGLYADQWSGTTMPISEG